MDTHKTGTTAQTEIAPNRAPRIPRLLVTHKQKGGVGSSTIARAMADFLAASSLKFQTYDAEGTNGHFQRFYPDSCRSIDLTSPTSTAPVLDRLMSGDDQIALIDVGARLSDELETFLRRGGSLEEANKRLINITILYVLSGTQESVVHLEDWAQRVPSDVSYILAKNYGVSPTFDIYESSAIRKKLLKGGAREISIPKLDPEIYHQIDQVSAPFSAYVSGAVASANGQAFSYSLRRHANSWLRDTYAQFQSVVELLH